MRLALAIVAFAFAGAAAAEPVQDRYGPPRKAAPLQARPYEGRMLGWAGKSAPARPPVPVQAAVSGEPQPPVATPQLAPPPVVVASAPAPARSQPPMTRWAADPLPQSLYDAPAAPPAPARASEPAPAPRTALVAAAPPPAPERGAAPSRLYSLHREYGMAPDTVPAAPSRTNYVLIGPADAPADAEGEEAPARKPPPVDARLF